MNVADEVTGAQIGIVNIARKVRGTQIGLMDIAEEEQGAPIGLVTVVKNGIHEVELSSNEVGATLVSAVLGTPHVYTRLGAGLLGAPGDLPGGRSVDAGSPADRKHLVLQWGMGGRFRIDELWFVEGELFGTQFYRTDRWHQEDAVVGSLRLLGGFRLTSLVSVVFGPSYNVSTGWNGTDLVTGAGVGESVSRSGQTTVRMYPGLTLGLRV